MLVANRARLIPKPGAMPNASTPKQEIPRATLSAGEEGIDSVAMGSPTHMVLMTRM